MQNIPKPGPHLFKNTRSTSVPTASGSGRSRPLHGYCETIKPYGDTTAIGYTDTGILLSFGSASRHDIRQAFLKRYEERLCASREVRGELTRLASKDPMQLAVEDRPKVAAARTAQRSLLTQEQIPLCGQVDSHILNGILDQLAEYAAGGLWQVQHDDDLSEERIAQLEKHSGEAVLIAHAMTRSEALLLTNDAGASAVAENRGVRAWHYGHLLREMVCRRSDPLSVTVAVETFGEAMKVSALRADIPPPNLRTWMTCARLADGSCKVCNLVA